MKIKEKDYWICTKQSGCAKDIFGQPNCELCNKYRKCEVCGRADTTFCEKCIIVNSDEK